MTETPDTKTQALYDFTRQWLGRDLSDAERAQLRAFAVATQSASQGTSEALRPAASSHAAEIERARQRIDAAGRSVDTAMREGDQAVHDAIALAAAQDMGLPKGHAGLDLDGRPSVDPRADLLAETIRREVQAQFDRHFAVLAQQMQEMVDAARAQNVIASPPSSAD
ncbi:hypothetical protein [Xanthomonas medicagonis]|uniref:hypothetical protein n=1 Tax=Xanthomonas medicagonis TaxID=3160841 RepID=UPI003518B3BE